MLETSKKRKIGGVGMEVEMDKSMFGKRKAGPFKFTIYPIRGGATKTHLLKIGFNIDTLFCNTLS